jgi:hypothetical protein
MPLYWTVAQRAGVAVPAAQQTAQNVAAGLAAASWTIAGGIAWWFGDGEPVKPPEVEQIRFEPPPPAYCSWHPFDFCGLYDSCATAV